MLPGRFEHLKMIAVPPQWHITALYRRHTNSLNFSSLSGQITSTVFLLVIFAFLMCVILHYAAERLVFFKVAVRDFLFFVKITMQRESTWNAIHACMPGTNFNAFEHDSLLTKRVLFRERVNEVVFLHILSS